jgi:hypothetical protein
VQNGAAVLRCFLRFGVGDAAPFFNPLLAKPELALDTREDREFLVKWTVLGYKHCSWEGAGHGDLAERLESLKGARAGRGASIGCGAGSRR